MKIKFIFLAVLFSILTISCENYLSPTGEDDSIEFTPSEKQLLSSANKFGFNPFKETNKTDIEKKSGCILFLGKIINPQA